MRTLPVLAVLALGATAPERLVFLGDSITDGHTLPLLVRQALGDQAPVCINAGLAGDTAAGMRARLDRDVLSRQPTRVVLFVGVNDALHGVSPGTYEADVRAIVERLKRAGVPMILLTPTLLGPKHDAAESRLEEYRVVLRRVAEEERYPLAEVRRAMEEELPSGVLLLEPDQVHLTFAGYRVLARTLLAALHHPKAEVPDRLALAAMPGVLPRWRIRALGTEDWKPLSLPQPGPAAHWWVDQERRRGFAVELDREPGGGKRFQAETTLDSPSARDVFLNTGADLQSITLNGVLVWKSDGWTGWHAGKERLPARLAAGPNQIRIETGPAFFLSVTDENSW